MVKSTDYASQVLYYNTIFNRKPISFVMSEVFFRNPINDFLEVTPAHPEVMDLLRRSIVAGDASWPSAIIADLNSALMWAIFSWLGCKVKFPTVLETQLKRKT